MLDGQHHRVDIPVLTRTAHKGHQQKKTRRGSLLNRPSSPLVNPIDQGTELNRILWSLHPMIYDCTPQNKASHQHDNKYVGLLMNRLPRIILTVFSDADGNYSVL